MIIPPVFAIQLLSIRLVFFLVTLVTSYVPDIGGHSHHGREQVHGVCMIWIGH
jgi:hypothetical protein